MTIPFHSSSKMLIGVLFTFSAVFQVSVNGAAMSSGAESNCSMPTEVAACASICNEEKATCLEFKSTSACICKSTPIEGQYRCEKGDELDGSFVSDYPLMMEKCEKIASSFSDVDHYLCSPKSRRGSDFMCAFQDRTEEHDIVKRAKGKTPPKTDVVVPDDTQTDEDKMGDLLSAFTKLLPDSLKPIVESVGTLIAGLAGKLKDLIVKIPKTIEYLTDVLTKIGGGGASGSRRRRAITEL